MCIGGGAQAPVVGAGRIGDVPALGCFLTKLLAEASKSCSPLYALILLGSLQANSERSWVQTLGHAGLAGTRDLLGMRPSRRHVPGERWQQEKRQLMGSFRP